MPSTSWRMYVNPARSNSRNQVANTTPRKPRSYWESFKTLCKWSVLAAGFAAVYMLYCNAAGEIPHDAYVAAGVWTLIWAFFAKL